jgi:uncharacterized membrane protein
MSPIENQDWLMRQNCSLSPKQLAIAYAVLCLVSFVVAAVCTLRGAWHVCFFTVLEMAAVALAFINYGRHATDQEHIALSDAGLLVEQIRAGRVRQIRLDPYWTRVDIPSRPRDLIGLEAKGVKIAVGRYVTQEKRRQIARELCEKLQSGWHMKTPAYGFAGGAP